MNQYKRVVNGMKGRLSRGYPAGRLAARPAELVDHSGSVESGRELLALGLKLCSQVGEGMIAVSPTDL